MNLLKFSLHVEMPLGAVPVLKTAEGTINQSQAIARYLAKKFGK